MTLPTDVNGVGSVGTGAFVAGHVSCFQMSLCSHCTCLVGSGDDEMQFHDRWGGRSVMVQGRITMTDRTPSMLCKEGSLGSSTDTIY